MPKDTNIFQYVKKSKFVRSVLLRVLAIFLIVSIAIAGLAFTSFTSEISKNKLADRQRQLSIVEDTISKRMNEIASIAYAISTDSAFYLEPVAGNSYSDHEMSNALDRYLAGNSFIEHLAYYRLSEPDKIYVSSGERSFIEFWTTNVGLSKAEGQEIVQQIQETKTTMVVPLCFGGDEVVYYAYIYPLPQLSIKPQAYVLMLIPVEEVSPLLDSLLRDPAGEVAVYDGSGTEMYRKSSLDEAVSFESFVADTSLEEESVSENGTKFVLQKVTSDTNGWTYVSAIRENDTISGHANRQVILISLLLLLMLLAIVAILVSIIIQYKPISSLAAQAADGTEEGGDKSLIDERTLLSNTFATLKDDSEQKQRYEQAYYEAEAANRAKSAFLSNMSHDIRTPMNAVIGMTALAYTHADDPKYVRDCLQKVQVSSRYLLDIINNVLDMSRIESGRFELSKEVIDLPEIIESVVVLVEPSMDAKGQHLVTEVAALEDARVIGDSVRLSQVFVNILSNSVKFTPEGGTIHLHVVQKGLPEAGYGDYVFRFSDTGIGIAPEFVGQVFDTFSRADGEDVSKVEGTGLGLAIAKNLVELMGGTITCESELGSGTTFTITMHMKIAGAVEKPLAQKPAGRLEDKQDFDLDSGKSIIDLGGKRLLLAEDNTINREIACMIISETGAEIVEAVNGQEAVDSFVSNPPGYFDIILMDLQMPILDGYEAVEKIRSMDRADAKTVPIYAMTASTFDDDVRQVLSSGMDGHISKPYMPETLYKVLCQVLLT